MRISIGQMDVRKAEPDTNLAVVSQLAVEAAARDTDLLLLPELWGSGYDLEQAERYATAVDDGLFAATAELAAQHDLYIFGSLLSSVHGEPTNTGVLFDPEGRAVAEYSKLHLFRLMDEDRWLAPGPTRTLAEAPWGRAGLSICYDLRFPELYRTYALDGAHLFLVPAQWPHPRLSHWRTLLRARAIENQVFVVACNRVGETEGTEFCGHSAIVDPWGETIVEAGEEPVLLTADVDLGRVDEVRLKIPVFQDRRPDVYADRDVR